MSIAENESAILMKDVWVRYDQHIVLEAIDLDVTPKEIVTIVGPNGSGKTTLLHTILGIKRHYQGRITLFGHKAGIKNKQIPIGYLPQGVSIESRFPVCVFDVIAFSIYSQKGLFYSLDSEDRRLIHTVLERVEISDLINVHFGSLSGGQKQRVLIARALALHPKILILDEPATGLDIVSQDRFYSLLDQLRKEENVTIIMVSHDIGAVSGVVDRVACLNRRIHFHGKPSDGIPSEALRRVFGNHVQFVFHSHNCQTCESTK